MERDARDAGRDIAPLKRAPDALFIDSSDMTVEQVKNRILEFIRAEP
jgi:cytidylate kinase